MRLLLKFLNPRRIKEATDILQTGEPLPERYRDHALTGN